MRTDDASASVVTLPYHSVRNISSPEDARQDRKVLAGHMPIAAAVDLPTDENVRDYLLDAEGRKRRYPTQVHRAIRDTLWNRPEDFSVLNGGIVIVARDFTIDERGKTLTLVAPSIINGSQTQGVIRDFLKEWKKRSGPAPEIHVKFEAIITTDDPLIAEVSIARNFQNDVLSVSIAGRRGQLDELEQALQSALPKARLRKSETHLSEDFLETEHLLQVITLLIPEGLWFKEGDDGSPNKVYAYSRQSQCLKEYTEIHDAAHGGKRARWLDKVPQSKIQELHQFYLDIASTAYQLHQKWRSHQGFQGTGLRAIQRDGREIVEVPDGIIFPIIASLSAFARKDADGRWGISQPEELRDEELIQAAKEVYQEVARSKPFNMGRLRACYSPLYRITSIYKRLDDRRGSAGQ
jgi:hypothetical protein